MTTHLHILQLEEYDPIRFLKWWIANPLVFKLQGKKPLVWTPKAKLIYALSGGFWPLMFLALLILKPYEIINRKILKDKLRNKIVKLKQGGLKVIAISGSYGKTSVKEYLYQILKTKYKVLRTPGNYNTLFGIAKVVDLELDETFDYFICEMGAYKRGEISELCDMVKPDYGILTGINEQHLERFGNIENTIKAKFELVEFVKDHSNLVLNFGNELVKSHAPEGVVIYGQGKYKHPQDQNIEGAIKMAKILGVVKIVNEVVTPLHRLSVTRRDKMTIIDDAYSSNVDGFKKAVEYLKTFEGWRVIVTPGITELGKETGRIHQELRRLLKGLDQVILVGNNERTRGLKLGVGENVEYVDKVGEAMGKVQKTEATILFENDLPDNY